MPKERAPISTRTRNKNKLPSVNGELTEDNRERSVPIVSIDHSTDNSVTFSPRDDPEIYLDELHTNLSFIRGTDDEKSDFLKEEHERIQRTFGKQYNATVKISTFYQAHVSAPVPSKRTRHRERNTIDKAYPSYSSTSLLKKEKSSKKSSHSKNRSKVKLSTQRQQPQSFVPVDNDASHRISEVNSSLENGHSQEHLSDSTVSLDDEEKRSQLNASSGKSVSVVFTSKLPYAQSSSSNNSSNTLPTTIKKPVKSPQKRIKGTQLKPVDEDYVPVPLSSLLPAELEAKDKEKEYWRRQRRVFVYSRFITNEEGLRIAQSVYGNEVTAPNDRSVTSFQGNIANFRTKLRRILDSFNDKFQVQKIEVQGDEDSLRQRLSELVMIPTLKVIWKHWIADPFVDVQEFYEDQQAVNLLKDVTVRLIIIHFKEQYGLYTPRQARVQMRVLDKITRTLRLPDATEYA